MTEWFPIALLMVFSLAFYVLLAVATCIAVVFLGRWLLAFGVRVGLASAFGQFGAAIVLAYRRGLEDP